MSGGYDRGGGGYDNRGGSGRGSGYGGGNRGGYGRGATAGGGGGRGSSGAGRDADWTCPDPSCGNVNFARRTECNKCQTPNPAGGNRSNTGGRTDGGYNRSSGRDGGRDAGGYNRDGGRESRDYNSGGNRGGRDNRDGGGDRYDRSRSGGTDRNDRNRSDNGSGYNNRDSRDNRDGGYNNNRDVSYGGGQDGNFNQVPPPAQTYPAPPYNSMPAQQGYGYAAPAVPAGGYAGPAPGGGYREREVAVEAPAVKVKQCDENCGDNCDNARIYISNLPPDVSIDELQELFGGIGLVGRIKQKRGYKDQWPYNIKIYTDDGGKNKGDACLAYEDPSAAHSASSFYNNFDMRGFKINVAMAEKSAPKPQASFGGGRGGYGGDRRGGGPDRHYGGGQRSKPY